MNKLACVSRLSGVGGCGAALGVHYLGFPSCSCCEPPLYRNLQFTCASYVDAGVLAFLQLAGLELSGDAAVVAMERVTNASAQAATGAATDVGDAPISAQTGPPPTAATEPGAAAAINGRPTRAGKPTAKAQLSASQGYLQGRLATTGRVSGDHSAGGAELGGFGRQSRCGG